jgi:hypothetical protein
MLQKIGVEELLEPEYGTVINDHYPEVVGELNHHLRRSIYPGSAHNSLKSEFWEV